MCKVHTMSTQKHAALISTAVRGYFPHYNVTRKTTHLTSVKSLFNQDTRHFLKQKWTIRCIKVLGCREAKKEAAATASTKTSGAPTADFIQSTFNGATSDKQCQNAPTIKSNSFTTPHVGQVERRRIYAAFGALCLSSVATLAAPRLFAYLVDAFGTGGSASAVIALATDRSVLLGCVLLGGALASGIRLFLAERIAYRLRVDLFKRIMHNSTTFHDKTRTGDLINKLIGDVTITSRAVMDMSFGIRNVLTVVISAGLVATLVPSSFIATLVAPVCFIFIVGMGYGKLVRALSTRRQDALSTCAARAEEKFANIKTVRQFNGEILETKAFAREMNAVYDIGRRTALAAGGQSTVFYACGGALLLHLVYRCGILVASGAASLGDVTSLMLYVTMFGASAQGIVKAYGDLQKALGACERVLTILKDEDSAETDSLPIQKSTLYHSCEGVSASSTNGLSCCEDDEASGSNNLYAAPVSTDLIFENVHFRYPLRPQSYVFQGLNLAVPDKSTVAIVGESGSGKSSLAAILLRLYPLEAGRILFGGIDITERPPQWIRRHVGLVDQTPVLFGSSVKENVLYGLSADEELQQLLFNSKTRGCVDKTQRLKEVLTLADAQNFVEQDLNGVDAFLGERGSALSGGQRQRLCLARILAKKPSVLVLDEATSALDTTSERAIHHSLSEMRGKVTSLVITHRLSMLDVADYVAVLGNAGVIEQFADVDVARCQPGPTLEKLLLADATWR